jgi:hypothetical protein
VYNSQTMAGILLEIYKGRGTAIEMANKIPTTHKFLKENRKRLAEMFLLGIWALFQFFVGNKIYGLFIIVFYLILVMSRSPNFILVVIPVLVIVLFNTSTLDTGTQLKQWNLNTVQNYKRTLIHIFTPNSGWEVLPGQVQQMLSLLRSNHVTSYQLSPQLYQDPLIMERVVESAWPIKMDSASSYRLSLINETNDNLSCVVIDHTKEVTLAKCH